MSKEIKAQMVESIKEKMGRSAVLILTNHQGLSVSEVTILRRALRDVQAEYKILKNNLTERAVEGQYPKLKDLLKGPTSLVFGFSDPVSPAKVIFKFIAKHEKLEVKGGIVEQRFSSAAELKDLSRLPSREVLLTQMVNGVASPLLGLLGVLQGPLRNLVYILEAVRKERESSGKS